MKKPKDISLEEQVSMCMFVPVKSKSQQKLSISATWQLQHVDQSCQELIEEG